MELLMVGEAKAGIGGFRGLALQRLEEAVHGAGSPDGMACRRPVEVRALN